MKIPVFNSIDEVIDYAEKKGRLPAGSVFKRKTFGVTKTVNAQRASGVIEFYYNDEFVKASVCRCQKHRRDFMAKELKSVSNLSGEKYFLWKPETHEREVTLTRYKKQKKWHEDNKERTNARRRLKSINSK